MKSFLILAIFAFSGGSAQIGCRDENNNLVDWYYLYKLPKVLGKTVGLEYVFITSSSGNESAWSQGRFTINSSDSLPGKTISQLYGNVS